MAKFYDTLIGEYITNPGARGLSLDKLAERNFDYKMVSYDEITSKGKIDFQDIDLLPASLYSAEDVYMTNKIYELQKKNGVLKDKVFQDIETPLLEVLINMEITGVKIDRDRLKGIGMQLENEIRYLEKRIYELAEGEFNIKSPKQVGEILFEKLQLPKGKKTKTGWSVSAEVLLDLAHENPIAQLIVDYRHYSKLLSTYVEGLIELLDDDDFVHTSYNQTVTTTGRLSSTKPNLQNIPVSESLAGEIRDGFVSRFPGGKIMAFDYSQVEVRLLAILSGDENLLSAFKKGLDIHHRTAELIFGKKTISSSERKISKAVNFGIIYGISSFGLSKQLGVSMKDAKKYIDDFYENYPKVKAFFDETIKNCEDKGYVETVFGRKRYIPSINDRNAMIKKSAEREAINMPIQGTSADIIKIAMIEINNFLQTFSSPKLKSCMIMQVHDELVFDVYPGEEEILEKEIKKIMQGVLISETGELKVKELKKENLIDLKVDFGIGKTWRAAK